MRGTPDGFWSVDFMTFVLLGVHPLEGVQGNVREVRFVYLCGDFGMLRRRIIS